LPTTDDPVTPGVLPGVGTTIATGSTGGTVPTVRVSAAALSTRSTDLNLDLFWPFVVAGLGVLLLGQLLRIRGVRPS